MTFDVNKVFDFVCLFALLGFFVSDGMKTTTLTPYTSMIHALI